jgi:hypothetical protein
MALLNIMKHDCLNYSHRMASWSQTERCPWFIDGPAAPNITLLQASFGHDVRAFFSFSLMRESVNNNTVDTVRCVGHHDINGHSDRASDEGASGSIYE